MKKYGLYKMTGESRTSTTSAADAYDSIYIDNCAELIDQYDDLDEAKAALSKLKSDKREYRYVVKTYFCEIYYVAFNENLNEDEDEDEVIRDGDIVVFAEFENEDEDIKDNDDDIDDN